MAKKRYRPEETSSKLREVDVYVGQWKTVALAIKETGASEGTYDRWRREYGGMGTSQQSGDTQIVCPRLNITKKSRVESDITTGKVRPLTKSLKIQKGGLPREPAFLLQSSTTRQLRFSSF